MLGKRQEECFAIRESKNQEISIRPLETQLGAVFLSRTIRINSLGVGTPQPNPVPSANLRPGEQTQLQGIMGQSCNSLRTRIAASDLGVLLRLQAVQRRPCEIR